MEEVKKVNQNLIAEPCTKDAWEIVLGILKDTQLNVWLSGKEKYEDFYTVQDPAINKIIACFTFTQKDSVGILKNFAVWKNLQGKGTGSYIANEIIPRVAKARGIKMLYLHGNDRPPFTSIHFWKKTIYTHIMSHEVKDQFYIDYFNYLVNNYSEELLYKEAIFFLDLEKFSV